MKLFPRRHRCCTMCQEEYQSESITRPAGENPFNLMAALRENTAAREELTEAISDYGKAIDRGIEVMDGHSAPTHIQTSAGIVMNLPSVHAEGGIVTPDHPAPSWQEAWEDEQIERF